MSHFINKFAFIYCLYEAVSSFVTRILTIKVLSVASLRLLKSPPEVSIFGFSNPLQLHFKLNQ